MNMLNIHQQSAELFEGACALKCLDNFVGSSFRFVSFLLPFRLTNDIYKKKNENRRVYNKPKYFAMLMTNWCASVEL